MGKDLGCLGQSVRIAFIVLNIIFVVIGLALLGLGIYLVAVGNTYEFITQNQYASAAPILIVCGAVTAIIAVVGIIAAIGLWWPVLLIYFVIILVVVILEIVAGILGFVFRSELADYYADTFNDTLSDYRLENDTDYQSDVNDFIDTVQENFECCGINSPYDWERTEFYQENDMFPESCICDNEDDTCTMINNMPVYSQGCNESFFEFIEENAAVIGGVGIAFGIFEIFGIVFAIILCCCLFTQRNKDNWTI